MEPEKYMKSIEQLLLSKATLSNSEVNPKLAHDILDGWMGEYSKFEQGKLNSMGQGKLYMDYHDNVRPNLIGARFLRFYDSFAEKLE